MNETRTDRLLDDWDAVASQAVRPATAPRPATIRSRSGGGFGLLPLAAGALAIALAVAWLGGHEDRGVGDASPSPDASIPVAPPSPQASEPMSTPSEQASSGAVAPCDSEWLTVAITAWDGAAGSRTASVTLRLTGGRACAIDSLWRPELVDDSGRIRIEGGVVRDTGTIALQPGETLTTLAQASNDCGPTPLPPVTIAFVLGDGSRVVAAPPSPDDTSTPPCNGPGQPGSISMQPWTR